MPTYLVSFRILVRADTSEEAQSRAEEIAEKIHFLELEERKDYTVEAVEEDPRIR